MVETVMKILAQELTTVRILCRKGECRGVIELPVEQLKSLPTHSAVCPLCKGRLISAAGATHGELDTLPALGEVLETLRKLTDELHVEFPIRIETGIIK